MFEKFTDAARRVVVLAQQEAQFLSHNYIGVEHVVLGILSAYESGQHSERPLNSVGAQILHDAGMTVAWTRDTLLARLGVSQGALGGNIPFTPKTRKALEEAMREAMRMGYKHIDVDHLLLGVLKESEALANSIIASALRDQMTLDEFRAAIVSGMTGAAQGEHPAGTGAAVGSRSEAPGSGGRSKGSLLEEFGVDLVAKARDHKMDPVIGREREMDRMARILGRRTKNNPILIGDPGVGKTAIVEGLAQRVAAGDVPRKLQGARIFSLDLGQTVAGMRFRGDFEERLNKIIQEATSDPDIILFIDEIHTLVGAGAAEGAIDAATILKPKLARGELRVIGATTHDEYVKHFEKDAALDRRFQPIDVDEPSVEDAKAILRGLSPKFAEFHEVSYEPGALDAAVDLSVRYLNKRFLPDKAIDLIDEAASHVVNLDEDDTTVEVSDIVSVLEGWTGGRISQAVGAEAQVLKKLEDELGRRVIGQREGLSTLSRAVRRSRAGLKDPRRPAGSFVFLGPSGVGKTETAKALAEFLYGSEDALITIDMSEYMEKHTVSRLAGAPPGYIGHDEGGQLTEAVRRRPFSVVLFDEFEKAHQDVSNVLLQILEEGRLTDSKGRKVDFSNTVIILTSNLGTAEMKKKTVGFGVNTPEVDHERMRSVMNEAFRTAVRPEFLNRIDEVVVFSELSPEDILQIVNLMVNEISGRLAEKGAELVLTEDARKHLARVGYNREMGARPLRRTIQRLVEDELSMLILDGEVGEGCSVVVDLGEAEDGSEKLVFSTINPTITAEPATSGSGGGADPGGELGA